MKSRPSTYAHDPAGSSHILVLRGGAVGDFILTLPALTALRRHWPKAHIDLATYPHVSELGVAGGLADRAISLDKADFARLFAANAQLSPEMTAMIRSYDLIVNYLNDSDTIFAKNLLSAGARRLIHGTPFTTDLHMIDRLLKPLDELGIPCSLNEYARLCLSRRHREDGRRQAAVFGDKIIALHPGSGSPKKNWPVKRFILLARRIMAETRMTPVFTLGEADDIIALTLRSAASDIPVLPTCSLVELAQFLSACTGYVGNDSGITHLAAAVGIPVIALFGPTDPRLWAPRGPDTTVLVARQPTLKALAAISVDAVLDTLLQES